MSFLVYSRHLIVLFFVLGLTTAACGQSNKDNAAGKNEGVRFRTVTADFSVAPQLNVKDIREAANMGYTLIINNRPDGEGGPDQPTSAMLAQAAKKAGISYVHIPFRSGHVTDDAFTQMKTVLAEHDGKTVSFCRSGTRAVTIWAMAQSALGTMLPDEAIKAARGAGYNLERHRARLDALAAQQTP